MIVLIGIGFLSHSFLACEGPRGPLCDPFRPSVENHIWFWWPEGIAGFEFDDNGNLLYIVDGIPSSYGELISSSVQKEFQKLPFTGEFTYWHPIKEGGLGGFWLKHWAVKELKQPWGTVYPGVDNSYYLEGGKHIAEFTREDFSSFKDQPFDSSLPDYLWKIKGSELYGMEFDRKGSIRYLVHGVPGTYSLNDAPSSGEYTVWYPVHSKSEEGYWLKHIAVREFRMLWGKVTPGVDLRFTAKYNLKDLTKNHAAGYTDQPFTLPLKDHIWKIEKTKVHGFRFDSKGKLQYIVEGISGRYSLNDVPYCGEYTVWYPVTPSSQYGYWLKYTAVTDIETFWGNVEPGIDYNYKGGKSIGDLPPTGEFTFEPFTGLTELQNCIWKQSQDQLYGAQFDEDGQLIYLVHGVPGTYSLNDVPLCGEYVVWFPIKEKAEEGFWLKFVYTSPCDTDWGSITYGVDLSYFQKEGHGISYLTRDHYDEGWDLGKYIKYLWDLLDSD